MTDFMGAMSEEIDQLERELEKEPVYMKLKRLRELAALYKGAEPSDGENPRSNFVLHPKPKPKPAPGKVPSPSRLAALDASADVLMELDSPYPVKTKDIFDLLPDGIAASIGGKDPKSNLSAMLSNSPRFVSHGRDGWSLAGKNVNPAPNGGGLTQEQAFELERHLS